LTVGVLLLAGGRSQRFGSDKRQAQLADGRTLLDTTIDQVLVSGLPLLVCLPENSQLTAAALAARNVDTVLCSDARQGMGATLAQGARYLPEWSRKWDIEWSGLLVGLADMPWVAPETYRAVANALTEQSICVPTFHGERGHPVGFGMAFLAQLKKLQGDVGARGILATHADCVETLAVDDAGILRDVDSRLDLVE
jgi:molybdenum cofactor cytidylyltransferase